MLGSGDFDLMDSFFSFYMRNLPLARERVKTYWGHGGIVFPETLSLFGLFPSGQVGYGCDKRFGADWPAGSGGYKPAWYITCAYLRYHYNSAIEVTAAMLEHYRHTQSAAFAKSTLLPFSHEVVLFYYSHYQDWHGTWVISPGQSLETWQEAINPSEQIAGIRSILAGLMALPTEVVAAKDPERELWSELEAVMPPLPMDDDSCTAGPANDQQVTQEDVAAEAADAPALAHAECESRPCLLCCMQTNNAGSFPFTPYVLWDRLEPAQQHRKPRALRHLPLQAHHPRFQRLRRRYRQDLLRQARLARRHFGVAGLYSGGAAGDGGGGGAAGAGEVGPRRCADALPGVL